jgi:hypothetical protein
MFSLRMCEIYSGRPIGQGRNVSWVSGALSSFSMLAFNSRRYLRNGRLLATLPFLYLSDFAFPPGQVIFRPHNCRLPKHLGIVPLTREYVPRRARSW